MLFRNLIFRMPVIALLWLIGAVVTLPNPAYGMETADRIVAVVNEDIITKQQLNDRLGFALKNISGQLTPAQRDELIEAQLKELIEEELILQYARENNYNVSEQQMQQAIANLEQQNEKGKGSFLRFAGDARDSALRSVRTSVLTRMIRDRELKSRVSISDQEVTRIVEGIISRQGENTEKKLAQIFLPVDDSEEEQEVKKTITRLYKQLKSGKADFSSMARAYSRDRSAKQGGELGWFRLGELVPAIEDAVKNTGKGELSPPNRSANGWHIFKVLDVRKPDMPDMENVTELRLLQLYAPIDSTLGTPAALQNEKYREQFKRLSEGIDTASEFEAMVERQQEKSPRYIASGDMGWVNLNGLNAPLQDALEQAEVGGITGPVSTDKGTYLFYVADERKQPSKALQNIRERVRQRLVSRQTDLEMRRLIRDLRRRAFVEVRL